MFKSRRKRFAWFIIVIMVVGICCSVLIYNCLDETTYKETAIENTESNITLNNKSFILEGTEMKREFCTVEEITPKNFKIKNTKGEYYTIDIDLVADFVVGDEVLLIYTDRKSIGLNTFKANVYAIQPDSSSLEIPG